MKISCYHVKVFVHTKTPKTPRKKPPPKIPNWLTKIPGKNSPKNPAKNPKIFISFLPDLVDQK
jgi:hypothetical protein